MRIVGLVQGTCDNHLLYHYISILCRVGRHMEKHRMLCFSIFLLWLVVFVQSYTRLDLGGKQWTVSEESTGKKVPGTVPGSMYTALLNHGSIQDPLYRDNDVNYSWIGHKDWTYSRTFSVSSYIASANQVHLVCDGLDTVATVSVNGKVVGSSDNMFVRSVFDLTGLVKKGDNTIVVDFKSAVKEALARVNKSSYTIPPECPQPTQHGECHVNQLRKEQCSFSWDWGPSFPTQGIWKPIYIDAFNSAIIREVTAVVMKVNSEWQVAVDVEFDVMKASEVKGQLSATLAGLNLTFDKNVSLSSTKNKASFVMTVPQNITVPLWWPNGYGNRPMFNLTVSLTSGLDQSERSIKVAFRTVELVQDPVSNKTEQGLTFYFRVNGIPIYLKGTNWIPADSFQERITSDGLRFLLQSAADVSINSMRVWGGGVYESDEFYDLCDELGIMVWQDFMFSVALYPTYKEFLDSIKMEVRHQVRRLKTHPSIILWAGNNENEKGLRDDWFHVKESYSRYYKDYVELYVHTIKPILDEEDASREYVVSSPSDGKESERQGYVAQDPGSELYGDIHFYDYATDQWNGSVFFTPRMTSEYGVQAWCNIESLSKVFAESDYAMKSYMVNHRQHHAGGNVEMAAEVGMHLNLPTSLDEKTKFTDFVYLTQINQAMAIKTQTGHYRRSQSKLLPDGRGLTMGALYWQLNDIWQAPTWASIDYEESWKMLHYYVKSFFNKQLISPYFSDSKTLDVYMVVDEIPISEIRNYNDGSLSFEPMFHFTDIVKSELPLEDIFKNMQAVQKATIGYLKIDMYEYSSFKTLFNWTVPYTLKSTAESVFKKKVSDLLKDSNCPSKEDCLLYFTATDQSGATIATQWFTLSYPKVAKLQQANIAIKSVSMSGPRTFDIEVSSDAIALFVWLSVPDVKGYFSDNGFLLLTPTTKISFYAREDVSIAVLKSKLKVRSVMDVKSYTGLEPKSERDIEMLFYEPKPEPDETSFVAKFSSLFKSVLPNNDSPKGQTVNVILHFVFSVAAAVYLLW